MSTEKYIDMTKKELSRVMSAEEKERTFFLGIFLGIFLSLAANIVDRAFLESGLYRGYALLVIILTAVFLGASIIGWIGALKARSRVVDELFKTILKRTKETGEKK